MKYTNIKHTTLAISIAAITLASCGNQSSTNNASGDTATAATMQADTSMATKDTAMSNSAMAKAKTKKKYKASIEMAAETKHTKYMKDKEGVYDYAEVMPSFPGGQAAIEDYINNQVDYPQQAIDDSKEGKVAVKFTVDENGKVTNAHVAGAKLGDGLDEQAVNAVSAMPDWKPGMINNKPVKVSMTMPILFKSDQ